MPRKMRLTTRGDRIRRKAAARNRTIEQRNRDLERYMERRRKYREQHKNRNEKKKRWTRTETNGFLQCFSSHKAEFRGSKKRTEAYAIVLDDMIALGYTNSQRTPKCLEVKMRQLKSAYKAARGVNNKGCSSYYATYMNSLQQIFGYSPTSFNKHTIDMGGEPVQMLDDGGPSLLITSPQKPSSSTSSSVPTPILTKLVGVPTLPSISENPSAREVRLEKKLQLKKKAYEKKRKLRRQKLTAFKKMLEQKWARARENECRKLDLLERIVNIQASGI